MAENGPVRDLTREEGLATDAGQKREQTLEAGAYASSLAKDEAVAPRPPPERDPPPPPLYAAPRSNKTDLRLKLISKILPGTFSSFSLEVAAVAGGRGMMRGMMRGETSEVDGALQVDGALLGNQLVLICLSLASLPKTSAQAEGSGIISRSKNDRGQNIDLCILGG
jgi:hypothetical protein